MKKLMLKLVVLVGVIGISICQAGVLPKGSWLELHVIPLVEVATPVCKGGSIETTKSEWYVLLGKNKNNSGGLWHSWPWNSNWDVLVAPKRAVQPTQILGITTVKSVTGRATDIFMKTVFNTLETLTQDHATLWTQSLYSRKDYMYYYQPAYVIPPTFVDENNRCYVFVKLLGKKTDDWLNKGAGQAGTEFLQAARQLITSRLWSNAYKSEFTWVSFDTLQGAKLTEGLDTVMIDNMDINRSVIAAVQTHGITALNELVKLDAEYRQNFDRQLVKRYETDLNEQLAKQAGESWFALGNTLFFNDDTPEYGSFGLYNTQKPLVAAGERYKSLEEFRTNQLASESDTAMNQKKDLQVVYEGLKAKIKGDSKLATMLQNTGGLALVYASKKDRFYGIGSDGRGQNHLGRMLMQLRFSNDSYDDTAAIEREEGIYPRLSLAQSTYNALLYRTLGKLPPVPALKKSGVGQVDQGQTVMVHTSGGQPSEVKRRIVKKEAPQPQETPEQKKAREDKEAMVKRMQEAVYKKDKTE